MNTTTLTCQHCKAPVPQSRNQEGLRLYCCNGCEQVAKLLSRLPEDFKKTQNLLIQQKQPSLNQYFYLDQDDFKELYRFDPKTNEYRVYIEGIYCSSCIQILESLPQILPSIYTSELRFGESLLILTCSAEASLSEIAETIEKMGYRPQFILPGQSQLEKQNMENRTDLMRIGVAAAVAANIMLLAISIYSGLSGEMANWFHLLEGILFLPLLFYSALPFYRGALRSLRFGKIGIDLPISIALLLSSIFSYRSLYIQSDQLYFDSTASFILLILASRYILKRIQQKNSNLSHTFHLFDQQGAWVQEPSGQIIYKPVSRLIENEVILVHQGDRVPVDGILESEHASIDFSLMTGEATPKSLNKGMEVLAGTKSYSDKILIRANKKYTESRLALMMQDLNRNSSQKTPFINRTDRSAQYLISLVLMIAIVFFIFYSQIDFEIAMSRSLALIVLACPCALALGVPLALSQGVRYALQNGIIIKNPEVLEKTMITQNLAFDKTGTLTFGELKLKECPLLSNELKSIILTLEAQSHHPIANAFRNTWKNVILEKVNSLTEKPGVGVSGFINDNFYELRKTDSLTEPHVGPQVSLYRNNQKLFDFYFQDQPRPETKKLLSTLKKWGFHIFLISGDHKGSVESIAQKIGLQKSETFSDMLPEDKKKWIESHPNTIMVGDGLNDTLGMAQSGVSISVKKSASEALEISDVYFADANISKVLDLILIANETKKVISRNIAFAIGYNAAAGLAALLGWIGPLGAALLMPLSSFVILANSFYGTSRLQRMQKKHTQALKQKNMRYKINHDLVKENLVKGAAV